MSLHARSPAEYEDVIEDLKREIKDLRANTTDLTFQLLHAREEKAVAEKKYASLCDKHIAQNQNQLRSPSQGSPAEAKKEQTRVDRQVLLELQAVQKELAAKQVEVQELMRSAQGYRSRANTWEQAALESQREAATLEQKLADAKADVDYASTLRAQRDQAVDERETYKRRLASAEGQLDEQAQRVAILEQRQTRADKRSKSIEALNVEKLMLDVKLADIENRLVQALAELTPARTQLAEAQRANRTLSMENVGLKEELQQWEEGVKRPTPHSPTESPAPDATDGASSMGEGVDMSLTDELENRREQFLSLKKEHALLREELVQVKEQLARAEADLDQAAMQSELQQKTTDAQVQSLVAAMKERAEADPAPGVGCEQLAAAERALRTSKEALQKAEREVASLKKELRFREADTATRRRIAFALIALAALQIVIDACYRRRGQHMKAPLKLTLACILAL
ncbi:hypothetical protein DIPPA_09174 [Diplonema papillatum]|nr:hypothetical protein DIPPA_09174 [Diplonema papillatum]